MAVTIYPIERKERPATQPLRRRPDPVQALTTIADYALAETAFNDPNRPMSFGRFTLTRMIGSGGMGVVYEAYDPEIDDWVALKILRPGLPDEARGTQRFLREARALSAIQHPRIVAVYDVGCEGDTPYIAMELLRGNNLEEFTQAGGKLSVVEIHKLAIEVAEGLEQIHEQELAHRDLKPGNIWLGADGVKLLDFGLARRLEGQIGLTASSLLLGTPLYMSPEHARGEMATPRSDLFALGVVLYELATAQRPFQGTTALQILFQITETHPKRANALNPAVPAPFSNFIMELLSKHPKDRPADARTVIERLKRIDPNLPALPPPPPKEEIPEAEPFLEESMAWKHWLATLFLCIVVFVGVRYWGRDTTGMVVIETGHPEAEVEILKDGERVALSLMERRFKLPAGTYLVRVLNGARLRVADETLIVRPGGEAGIRVIGR